jgi:glycine/D-amino acid oxidase-like deaminating enzyme
MKNWGNRPWTIDFRATKRELPRSVDFAVVGGGFTGLAAAAWLKHLASHKSVALFEAESFGAGSSGHTGGVALAETATGDLPGLGDVLAGYQSILKALDVHADLSLPGVCELGRTAPLPDSPIRWDDSGQLCATKVVPGGTIDPGKAVSNLARAAERSGALLFEYAAVDDAAFHQSIELRTNLGIVTAHQVLFATNAFALELTHLQNRAQSAFTLAVATEPLSSSVLSEIGLAERKPFYTVDLPYLWGRPLGDGVIFGSGLVFPGDWRKLADIDVTQGQPEDLLAVLQKRIHGFHPALRNIHFTHRWGGPIGIAEGWTPVFEFHPLGRNAIVLGAYSGHGVAQSVYLGAWAAEALLGKRELPFWR